MKRVLTLAIGLLLVLACVGTVSAGTAVNLVTNGGFEDPLITGDFGTYTGSGLTGWTTTGSIDLIHGYWKSHSGAQSIDLAGNERGKISQTINTAEPDGTYTISFWLAGNPHILYQGPKELNVYWDGEKVKSITFDTTGKTVDNMGWTLVTISGLKAKGKTTEIVFEQGETSNNYIGVALDDISVVDPVDPPTPAPEFPSMALPAAMLVGFMGVVLYVQKSGKD